MKITKILIAYLSVFTLMANSYADDLTSSKELSLAEEHAQEFPDDYDFEQYIQDKNQVIEKGYRLNLDYALKNYAYFPRELAEAQLTSYIRKANYKVSQQEAQKISHLIKKVSSCFQIDPWILTGLIHKESHFDRHATSPTKAAGLTQFTTIGIKEVNDQLGLYGNARANQNTILYFQSKLRNCVDPSWSDLWNLTDHDPSETPFYDEAKNLMRQDIMISISYGAILLKTYLAYIDNRDARNNITRSIPEKYYYALQIYNGEPGEAKVRYAKTIFNYVQNMYPTPLSFPFIK